MRSGAELAISRVRGIVQWLYRITAPRKLVAGIRVCPRAPLTPRACGSSSTHAPDRLVPFSARCMASPVVFHISGLLQTIFSSRLPRSRFFLLFPHCNPSKYNSHFSFFSLLSQKFTTPLIGESFERRTVRFLEFNRSIEDEGCRCGGSVKGLRVYKR